MKDQFSCVIVDDEPNAIKLLMSDIQALYKNVSIEGTYTYWEEALDALRKHQPDILFMDISMPGKNGLNLLRLLPQVESEVIFITAHEDFAIRSFEFSTAGYILKPIDDKILVAAIDKAIERVRNKHLAKKQKSISASKAKISIPNNKGFDYIDIDDIIYLESVRNYTTVVTKTQKILSSYNLGKYKSLLDNKIFQQVHRSYIVNINCITRYESTGIIIMNDKKEIPLSKAFRDDFLNLFSNLRP